jgi:hypothetical protein
MRPKRDARFILLDGEMGLEVGSEMLSVWNIVSVWAIVMNHVRFLLSSPAECAVLGGPP